MEWYNNHGCNQDAVPTINQSKELTTSLKLGIYQVKLIYNNIKTKTIKTPSEILESIYLLASFLLFSNEYDKDLFEVIGTDKLIPISEKVINKIVKKQSYTELLIIDDLSWTYGVNHKKKEMFYLYGFADMTEEKSVMDLNKEKKRKSDQIKFDEASKKKKSKDDKKINEQKINEEEEVQEEMQAENVSVEEFNEESQIEIVTTKMIEDEEAKAITMKKLLDQKVTYINADFNDFFNKYKDEYKEKVDMICTDSPYGVLKNSHDYISPTMIKQVVENAYHVLKGHGVIVVFTSWQIAHEWNEALKINDRFIVLKSPFFIMKKVSNNMRQSGGSNMQNMCEMAIVAYKRMNQGGNFKFNWQGKQHFIKGDYLRGQNIIQNYEPPRKLTVDGFEMRIEEKSVDLMMEIISRFTKYGDLVWDFFSGGASTALASIRLGRKWMGCDMDKNIVNAAKVRLLTEFTYYYTNKMISSSDIYQFGSVEQEMRIDNSKPSSNYPLDVAVLIRDGASDQEILDFSCNEFGLKVQPSTLHGEGLFADKDFIAGDTIVGYYGEVLSQKEFNKKYKDCDEKPHRAVKLTKKFKNEKLYIDGKNICPGVYCNTIIDLVNNKLIEPNAELAEKPKSQMISEVGEHDYISIVALKDIKKGEEIIIPYIQSNKLEDYKKLLTHDDKFTDIIEARVATGSEIFIEEQEFNASKENEKFVEEEEEEEKEKEEETSQIMLSQLTQWTTENSTKEIEEEHWSTQLYKSFQEIIKECVSQANNGFNHIKIMKMKRSPKSIAIIKENILSVYNSEDNYLFNLLNEFNTSFERNPYETYELSGLVDIENEEEINIMKQLYQDTVEDSKFSKKVIFEHNNGVTSTGSRLQFNIEDLRKLSNLKGYERIRKLTKIGLPFHSLEGFCFLHAEDGCGRQGFHTDYNIGKYDSNNKLEPSFSGILSLSDDNYIWFVSTDKDKNTYKRKYLKKGSLIIFPYNSIHAGDCGSLGNFRLFFSLESDTMKKDMVTGSQDFKSYAYLTNELNLYL